MRADIAQTQVNLIFFKGIFNVGVEQLSENMVSPFQGTFEIVIDQKTPTMGSPKLSVEKKLPGFGRVRSR